MSISNENRVAGPFIGNGVTTVLPFGFKVFAPTDLLVQRTNTSTGATTNLVLGADYTVALNSNQDSSPGGNVTLTSALASGYTSIVTSSIANLQPMVLTNLGGFLPTVINDMADRVTILVQQLISKITNAVRAPLSDGTIDMSLPAVAQRANNFLAFTSSGQPVAASAVSTGSLYGNITSLAPAVSDINVWFQATANVNNYAQGILQNTSSGGGASTDLVIGNNQMTAATYFLNLGMNSSGFTGSGSLNKTNAGYVTMTGGDLVIGTTTANAIRFVYSNSTTDAAYIDGTGLTVNGQITASAATTDTAVWIKNTTAAGRNYYLQSSGTGSGASLGAGSFSLHDVTNNWDVFGVTAGGLLWVNRRMLVNTTTDNGTDQVQVNGSITASTYKVGASQACYGPTTYAYQSSSQTGVTSSTITKVNLQSTQWDTNSAFNTGTSLFTVPVAGYYQVNGSVSVATSGSAEVFASIYQNSTEYRGTDTNLASHYTNVGVSCVLKCAVNDTIGLYIFQASGGSASLNGALTQTRLDITFIRGL